MVFTIMQGAQVKHQYARTCMVYTIKKCQLNINTAALGLYHQRVIVKYQYGRTWFIPHLVDREIKHQRGWMCISYLSDILNSRKEVLAMRSPKIFHDHDCTPIRIQHNEKIMFACPNKAITWSVSGDTALRRILNLWTYLVKIILRITLILRPLICITGHSKINKI